MRWPDVMRAVLSVLAITAALTGTVACGHAARPLPVVSSDIVAGTPAAGTSAAAISASPGGTPAGQPAKPVHPGQPGQPANPAQPARPAQPANPAQPGSGPGAVPPAGVVPAVLVGTWVSVGGGDAELVYRFSPDGVYRHSGVLLQQRPSGLYSIELAVRGTATAEGEQLLLRPESGTVTIKDPDSAEASGQRPAPTAAERYTWRVGAGDVLMMTGADGGTSQFRRDAGS